MMKNNFFQMNNDKPGDGLNHLIDEALHEFSDPPFRDDFTEKLLTRLQKKLEWQELILNFSLKIICNDGYRIRSPAAITAISNNYCISCSFICCI